MSSRRNLAAQMGHWSATHRKKAIWGWLGFVVLAFAIGQAIGMKSLTGSMLTRQTWGWKVSSSQTVIGLGIIWAARRLRWLAP